MKYEEFQQKWILTFAQTLSEREHKQYLLGDKNYIWQAFSYRLLDRRLYYRGNKARTKYDIMDKIGALVYDPSIDKNSLFPITLDYMIGFQIDEKNEVYIVDKDFKWCYMKTHEEGIGPFFIEGKNKEQKKLHRN